jgi:hypothetical protein
LTMASVRALASSAFSSFVRPDQRLTLSRGMLITPD